MGEQNPNPNPNPNPTRLETHPEDDPIPPDPLLDSGTFIHVDGECVQNGGDDVIPKTSPLQTLEPEPEPEPEPEILIDVQDLGVSETPVAVKKSKRLPEDMAERPTWLPEDWRIEVRMRTSGATAGTYDRYYFSPTSKKFRSKAEVLHFLETGTAKRKKVDADADGTPPASSESKKAKKTNSESKKAKKPKRKKGDFSGVDFDFRNPPQNVSWTLTNASHDIWTPISNEGLTPEAVKRTWDTAFSCITDLEGGK